MPARRGTHGHTLAVKGERDKVARLAKIGKQNECGGDKVYAEITSRARFLAATVPEEFWAEGVAYRLRPFSFAELAPHDQIKHASKHEQLDNPEHR